MAAVATAETEPTLLLERIAAFARQDRVQAGSLIVTVFGDAVLPRGARLWLGSLIELLAPLGINERLVRTAVYRLVQEGWLTTRAHGRRTDYLLTEAGLARVDEAARQIYAARAPSWDLHWRLLVVTEALPTRVRERLRRSLFWQGYGELPGGVYVHPSAELEATLEALGADGLSNWVGALLPLRAQRLPLRGVAPNRTLVQQAWNLSALAQHYAEFVARYAPIEAVLRGQQVPPEAAFLGRTLLIHDWRRLLLRDPQLPAELLPREWPGERARQVCRRLYRLLLAPAERHLDAHLRLADGQVPPPAAWLWQRFEPLDDECSLGVPPGL
ncbi:MAG: phenylacetic acid degradation operon negative regulatory protein PaaX [Tepidimonas sp.]|uniref:phenylacetic acid degradation operon negative regulatory protein PaaX n=1 Tax=Tepidimonas sp. TaxID=2002775 RepID=UPI00298EECA9|nr:phenylacetic acid degradation operon negative regulatory protein PaaX [Tepidimonas sp.]MDW8336702.1 phenylacetic acid degradation operon negative regulatory protein PaaX [Tepidimonas sp.]